MRTKPAKTLADYWEKFSPRDLEVMYQYVRYNPDKFNQPANFHKGMLPFISAQTMHDVVYAYNHKLTSSEMLSAQHICEVLKAHRPSILGTPYDPQQLRANQLRAESYGKRPLFEPYFTDVKSKK